MPHIIFVSGRAKSVATNEISYTQLQIARHGMISGRTYDALSYSIREELSDFFVTHSFFVSLIVAA